VASSGKNDAGAMTLEQLIALNDEMAALARAGIPLERGLAALGGELPGRPGKLAELLAARMSAGESLSQILADEQDRFPPVWRAVVEAGLRSGHLAAALESLSATSRRVADLRRLVGAGLLYPLILVTFAYALFLFLITWVAPTALETHRDLTGFSDPLLEALAWLGRTAAFWAIPLPLVAAMLATFWWHRSGLALWSNRQGNSPASWRETGVRRTLHNGRMATFAEVLALLIQEQAPLQQSVVLAAEAGGDRAMTRAAREIAERIQRGDVLASREDLPKGFPPLLGWLLLTGSRQPELSDALRRSAAVYRERAERAATWTAIYLPIAVTVVVGGTATLVCGLTVFLPIARLLYHLTWPVG